MMSQMVKLKLTYVLMVVFGLVMMIQIGLFAIYQVWGIGMQWNIVQYCVTAFGKKTAAGSISNVIFDLVLAYTLSRMIWRMMRQWYLTKKWLTIFRSNTNDKLTRHLNDKYRAWRTEIIVMEGDAFVALSIGMLRPKIVVSTGLLKLFNEREAEAILLHEWYHCRNRDNPKAFISTLIVDAFGYVPIIKAISHYYKTWKELLADRFAIKQMGTEFYLGSVLLKLANVGNLQQSPVGVHFADTAIHYRIMQVLEPNKTIKVPLPLFKSLLVSCSMLLLLMLGGCS